MNPRAFIDALWKYKPAEMYILIWTGQDKRSYWFRDVAAAGEFAESDACRDKCVFVGLGLSKTDNGQNRRCTSAEIAALCGIWSDLDLKSEAHKEKALPATVEEALAVLPMEMPPTITVSTGNGAQAWWLFREPLVFDTEEEKRDATRIINRWHSMLRLDCAARGWTYDRLSDFARVARVAGTRNLKDPASPKDVRVLSCDESRRYNLSEFDEYLDEAAIPDTEGQERAARERSERFKDTPLIVNPSARFPQDVLEAWMNEDSRFRNTWERRRHDLKDPSQSGYDLALADFGIMVSLSAQETVDLIVHHRAIHGQKQRTRVDYFERTIAKALSQNPESPSPAQPSASAAGAPTPPADQPQPQQDAPPAKEMSPERIRAELCARISAAIAIPIQITRLVQITGKDPSYRMELADGTKIEFSNTAKFVDQEFVRLAIAGQKKWLMAPMKPARWREIAQDMLQACFDEDGPIEAQWEEGARDMVAKYLEQNGFIDDIASAHPDFRGKPIVKDARVAINTTDLHSWINKTGFRNFSVKELASTLGAMGAIQFRMRGPKFREQSRWLLPLDHFKPPEQQKAVQEERSDATE
jgi:hypothetical protein